jgi:hypothetical protein
MLESPVILAAGIALVLAMLGSGVAFFVGRRSGGVATEEQADDDRKLPERFVQEVERCLELGDYVCRDADTLTAILAQTPGIPRHVQSAVQQLVKTTKTLTGRVNRVGADAHIARPERDTRPVPMPLPGSRPDQDAAPSGYVPAYLDQDEVDSAPQTNKEEKLAPSPFDDARKFRRSSFRGSAEATIYPRHPGQGREPVHCTVLTRDLSCGGVGIAHSEQLFPKQIVVLNAVGKLLVGEVRWCRRVDEHFYVAGCRLVKTNN